MKPLLSVLLLLFVSVSSASAQLVTRVVDGDTIVVAGVGSVHLIGVDTPETVDPRKPVQFFGREASEFTRRMAQGQIVRLEFQRTDKYQRTLAYVYLSDGTFLNAEIVKQGYGHAYVRYPFKYLDQFRSYEREGGVVCGLILPRSPSRSRHRASLHASGSIPRRRSITARALGITATQLVAPT